MLARLSAAVSQAERSEMSIGDEGFFFDMDTFRLVVPVPDITWGRVAQMCEHAVHPVCKGLYSILEKDAENLAQVLATLEFESDLNNLSGSNATATPSPEPTVIPSAHPSIPTIVITPCPRLPRDTASQVPFQDSAFRNQLTVPSLPSINESFPPMVAPRRQRGIHHWVWKNGHWQAAAKGLEPRPRVLKHRKKGRTAKAALQG